MTIQSILDAFIKQLSEQFALPIYDEEIPQNFTAPSFFLHLPKLTFKRMTGLNRLYELYVSVTYFATDKLNKNTEYNSVLQKITEEFDYLRLQDKLLHLTLIEQQENERDDALVFLFKLEVHTRKTVDKTVEMKGIEVHING